jgi:hypothetical protein
VARQPATRELELKAAIEKADLPARDYRVYRALLERAEWKSAKILDRFQPRSLNHLQRHGWLVRHRHFSDNGIGGRGHPTTYQLEHGRGCDCLPAVSRRTQDTSKGAHPEPVPADKGAQDEPRKGLRTCRVTAGQRPVSAKSVRSQGEVAKEGPADLAQCVAGGEGAADVLSGWPRESIGPCARCRQPCRRYGDSGSPLCAGCQVAMNGAALRAGPAAGPGRIRLIASGQWEPSSILTADRKPGDARTARLIAERDLWIQEAGTLGWQREQNRRRASRIAATRRRRGERDPEAAA